MDNYAINIYLIEVIALIVIGVVAFIGIFRSKYIHMMCFFLALFFICGVLLKTILP